MHRVRVVDREPGAHQAVDVVDLGAADVLDAVLVDDDLDAVGLDDLVLRPHVVVEGHPVLEARAAAARDEDAKSKLRVVLLGEEVSKMRHRLRGE